MLKKLKNNNLFRITKFLKKNWPLYSIGLIGLSFINFICNFFSAVGIKAMTDALLSKDMNALMKGIIFMATGFGILVIIIPFLSYAFDSSIKKTTGEIRRILFFHIEKLPVKYIENNHSGDLISRLTNDVQTAENAYGNQLLMVMMPIVSGMGSIIVIFYIDWRMAILGVIIGASTIISNTIFIKPLKKVSDKIQDLLSSLNQNLTDTLGGIQVIKSFNLLGLMEKKFKMNNEDIRKWSINRVIKNSFLNGINSFLGNMSFIGIYVIGIVFIINNTLTFGKLIAIIQMLNGVMWMFNSLGVFLTQLQSSLAGIDRIFEILDIKEEETTVTLNNLENVERDAQDGIIEFENIKFAYEETNVLNSVNIEVGKNEVIAIVGSSGGGKSTLFKLLLKFYNIKEGCIKVFGKDINTFSLEELRSLIAYVPQDNYLFSGTIADNISYGKENATLEQVIESAKSANAHEFIMTLSSGYGTEVGERGAHLSGGQRQRIAIARAILKNAPILLLDEATSSLDSESEDAVQKALDIIMKGRSTMVVAHRLSTIQHADKILVLDNGIIPEVGDHETLLNINGIYSRLYNLQFEGKQA
ncbi:ABC transporter ATP-binding protein [Clostridium akagii]|uniref:ABC transporter ATP-binding protein n=1 Tax=Clostridium akagii TaxID=91623 RepID=UPI00047ACCA2|nr:ABC transporter ATP-binding protein [Clostridium akagii]